MMPCPATPLARIKACVCSQAASFVLSALLVLVLPWAAAGSAAVQGSLVDPDGSTLSTLTAGSRFSLRVQGDAVTLDDRVRIVASAIACGGEGVSEATTPFVRWPFGGEPVLNYTEGELGNADAHESVPHSSDANAEGILLVWSDLAVLQRGGYKVCYCAATAAGDLCDADAEFGVEVFSFSVLGPGARQTFTCHAGWPCAVGPMVGDLAVGNRLRVMNKCYPPERTDGFIPGAGERVNETDIASDPTISVDSVGLATAGMFSWGSDPILGPGHRYELCWCSGSSSGCNQTEDFLARAGTLEVPGPTQALEILCSSSAEACRFAIEQGIALGSGDRIMALEDCSGAANMSTPVLPEDGLMKPPTNDGQEFEMPETKNSTALPVGGYRLCWCHHSKECLDSSDFRLDVGTLTIAGPTGGQSWVCTMGQTCTLNLITGITLAVDDYYIAASTCGVSGPAVGFRDGEVLRGSLLPMPSANSSLASFRWAQVRATTGTYQVCWAPAWQRPSGQSCEELGWNVTAGGGSASICAETELAAGSCSQTSASSAHAACAARGARPCLPHEIAQGEALGTKCAARDRWTWTGQSCGVDHTVVARVDSGAAGSKCEPRKYEVTPWQTADQLYWQACCADATPTNSSLSEYFRDVSNFRAAVGKVTIHGPFLTDAYCVMGDACMVTIVGLGLNGASDRLQIVHRNATCDDPKAVVATLDFEHSLANGTAASSSEETFSLGKSSSFDAFWMCWCSIGNGVGCTSRGDFFNTAGELLVGGINLHSFVCIFSQPCMLNLTGTNLGATDSILVALPGQKCGTTAAPMPEGSINPATTKAKQRSNTKTFDLGNITLHGDFTICYCIEFGTRACFAPGPVLERFSLTAGIVKVYGPFYNATPSTAARTGVAYSLQISGRELGLLNRITVQHVNSTGNLLAGAEGPKCGEEGSDVNDAAVMVPSSEPTSVATDGSQQVWDGVMVSAAGDYRVCWCLGDDDSPCTQSSSYDMQVAFLVVNGIWRSVRYATQIAGNPFLFSLNGRQLTAADRVLFISKSQITRCGDTGTMRYAELGTNAENAPTIEDENTVERWRNVVVKNVGEYLVCWCGHTVCDLDLKFGVEAAELTVTGPDLMTFRDEIAGEYFQLLISGVALSNLDRISIVDATVECGQTSADNLASTVVVANPAMAGSRVSAKVLGAPAPWNETHQSWGGVMIRWQGTYKVCWGGKHGTSGPCEGPTWKNCSVTKSSHHPFHVGNLRVTYGPASVVGQMQAVRCDSLDLNAFSPESPLEGSTKDALAAEWACTPCGEFCGSLQEHLTSLGSGSLHLHIPADVIANSLDRERWVSSAYGDDSPEERFVLSVTMRDTHNVTRWGSLPIVISTLKPLVYSRPSVVSITLVEELHLEVYTNFPGGIVCNDASAGMTTSSDMMETSTVAVNVSWSIAPSVTGTTLHLTTSEVSTLGVGMHNISARVSLGDAFAPEEVFFIVHIRSPPVPSLMLQGPLQASAACPFALDASTAADALYSSATLSYQWYSSCTGLQSSSCSGLGSGSSPVQIFPGGSLQAGQNSLGASVTAADGRASFSTVSVVVGSGGSWPFTPAPLPAAVPFGHQVDCAAIIASADAGSCAAPAGASWSFFDVQSNESSELTTERISIATGAISGLRLQATIPASMLQAKGQYRCILREDAADDTDVYQSDPFMVAAPPSGGRVIVAPISGVALQTPFSSTSASWVTEYPPLQHCFLVLPSSMPEVNATAPVDAARFLQGWSSESSVGYVLGFSGKLRMVARVRDALGSIVQATTEFEVQAPSASAILTGDISRAARWPPDSKSLLTASGAFVNAALAAGVNSSTLVSNLLNTLWNSVQLSSSAALDPEDLAMRSWVLEQSLLLAPSEPSVDQSTTAARVLEASASQGAAQAMAATQRPMSPSTTESLLRAASLILKVGIGSTSGDETRRLTAEDSQQEPTEIFSALRGFERNLGLMLRAQLRRSALLSGASAQWQEFSDANVSVLTGRLLRAEAASLGLEAYGLQLNIPSLASGGRRLAGASAILEQSCSPQHAEVQLWHWEGSIMDAAPWDQQVRFEGDLSDMVATWPSGYGLRKPYMAGVRLWLCPEGLQGYPGVSVRFKVPGGVQQLGSVQQVKNGSMLLTYYINVSWVCAQWDSTIGIFRAIPAMRVEVNASSIQCMSTLDAKQKDVVYLAAFPGARNTLQSERLVDPLETEEAGLEFDAAPLLFLLLAAVAVEIPMICMCLLDFRDRISSKASVKQVSPQVDFSERPSCMCFPAVSCSEGLLHLRPVRCCAWPCVRRKRRTSDVIPVDADVMPLPMPLVADAQPVLQAEPDVKEDALQRQREAHDTVENLRAQKWNQANTKFVQESCCASTDYQQAYKRDMLMASICGYRRLKVASDKIQQSVRGALGHLNKKNANVVQGTDVCLDSGVSREDEAVVLRVAHHVHKWLEQVLLTGDGFRLSIDEELSLQSAQKALGESFVRANRPATPGGSGTGSLGSGSPRGDSPRTPPRSPLFLNIGDRQIKAHLDQKDARPQPFFSALTSVRLMLLSIDKRTPVTFQVDADKKKPAKTRTSNTDFTFAGILPESQKARAAQNPGPAWADMDLDGVDALDQSADAQPTDPQPYLPGCCYFMWGYEKMLFVHRAETLRNHRQMPSLPLDEALARHEATRCYNLERDVEDVAVSGNDDRNVILSLRGGPVLRWTIDGEIRPWIESLRRPVGASASTAIDPIDLVHGVCRDPQTFVLYSFTEAPQTASNVYLESVMGYTEPCIMWSSHGGTTLSFAFWPNRDQVHILEGDAAGTAVSPLGAVAPEGAPPEEQKAPGKGGSARRVLAIYVSDIESLGDEIRENTLDASAHRFCLEIKMINGVVMRLCFNSRFTRMACQANLLRLRALLFPGQKPIQLVHKQQPGARNPAPALALGYSSPPGEQTPAGNILVLPGTSGSPTPSHRTHTPSAMDQSPLHSTHGTERPKSREWHGFYGHLELKVLSGCGLGLSAPSGMDGALDSAAILGTGHKAAPATKSALPVPKLFAYLPIQPRPRCMECRSTPDLPERTANPVWQCTWNFTVEFSVEEEPPSHIRFEVWNKDGRNEFLGEVIIPFPWEPGLAQYHCALEANPGKMKEQDCWKVPTGSISFQTRLKSERVPRMPEMMKVPPHLMQALCGTFGVEIVGGVGLRNADFLSSDPYCVVLVNTAPRQQCSWRTSTVYNTLNPIWRELHEFRLNWPNSELSRAAEVKIEVWDLDEFSNDEFLGEISFPLPTGNGENMLDLELQGNRSKGALNVKGRLRARVYFNDQFTEAASDNNDGPLEMYEAWFSEYFGSRDVDEQLARSLAAPLIFFHLSARRIFKSQFKDALRRATHELSSGRRRMRCYLELTSALWFALAVAAGVRALVGELWEFNYIVAAVGGFIGGVAAPNLAHILQEFIWQRPPPPASRNKHLVPVHKSPNLAIFSLLAILISVAIVGVCVGFTAENKADVQTLVSAAVVVVTRLVFVPLWQAAYRTFVLHIAKRSRFFDSRLRRNPSIITASGALLKGLPLHTLVPTDS